MTESKTYPTRANRKGPARSSWGAPKPKVAAGGAAGAATILVVFIAEQFGVDVPPEAASAFTTLISFGAAYLKKDRRS